MEVKGTRVYVLAGKSYLGINLSDEAKDTINEDNIKHVR